MNKCDPGELVHIHIQSLINIMHEKNWLITTKKGQDKLPLFTGNRKQVIPVYNAILDPAFGFFFILRSDLSPSRVRWWPAVLPLP